MVLNNYMLANSPKNELHKLKKCLMFVYIRTMKNIFNTMLTKKQINDNINSCDIRIHPYNPDDMVQESLHENRKFSVYG